MHKVRWTGASHRIPDLAKTVQRGEEFEVDDTVTLGGEGVNFDIIGGSEFDRLVSEAKDLKVSGYTKLTTRLDLERAVDAKKAELEAKEAEKAASDESEKETE